MADPINLEVEKFATLYFNQDDCINLMWALEELLDKVSAEGASKEGRDQHDHLYELHQRIQCAFQVIRVGE